MKTKILILLLTSYLFLGCNEDDNPFTLPDATKKGANTAGCYIDGDLYVLKNAHTQDAWIGSSKTLGFRYNYDEKNKLWYIYIYMEIEGKNATDKISVTFSLKSEKEFGEKDYQLLDYKKDKQFADIFGIEYKKNNTNFKGTARTTQGKLTLF